MTMSDPSLAAARRSEGRLVTGGPYRLFSGQVRTLNATPLQVRKWPETRPGEGPQEFPPGASMSLEVRAQAIDETNGDAASFLVWASFRRKTGAALERFDISTQAQVVGSAGAWGVTVDVGGSCVVVSVTGGANPVLWQVDVRALFARKGT